VDDVWSDLTAYEASTIVLRMNEAEAVALLRILVLCDLDHPQKWEVMTLGERLAYELATFQTLKRE
jgi:hypothetical protein